MEQTAQLSQSAHNIVKKTKEKPGDIDNDNNKAVVVAKTTKFLKGFYIFT